MKQTIPIDFEIEIKKDPSNETFHCYVPEIDSYYFAKTEEDIQEIGSALIKAWIQFWRDQNHKEVNESTYAIFQGIGNPDFNWEAWFKKYH
jgi:hypothetical protein